MATITHPDTHVLKDQKFPVLPLARVWARPSPQELGHRYIYDVSHCRHVAAMALSIFDQSQQLHGLGTWERRYLEMAALLHDIGCQINLRARHKHTYQLLRRSELQGFTLQETRLIALVARYHRKSPPSRRQSAYARLPRPLRRTVRVLAAILRLADGLDRGHAQNVCYLRAHWSPGRCQIELVTRTDPELEVWGALRMARLFEQEFGCTLAFGAETVDSQQVADGRTAFRWDGWLAATYFPCTLYLNEE